MANEIKAKLVLDTSGIAGVGAAAGGKGGPSFGSEFRRALEGLDLPILGDIGAALAGMLLVLGAIQKAIIGFFKFVASTSPIFATSLNLLKKSLQVLLRPIGDIMGLFLKPFAIAMLRFAIPIYKKWREFLQMESTQEGLKQINEGAGKVGAGIIALDFGMVKEGLIEIGDGIKDVAGGFLEFMGNNVKDLGSRLIDFFKDAWTFFSDIFKPVTDWIGEKLNVGLTWAWNKFWDFLGGLGDDEWKQKVEGFKKGLEGVWEMFGIYLSTIGKYWWTGPLAPMIAALDLLFHEVAPRLAVWVREAFEEEFPTIMAIFDTIDEKLSGEEGGSFFNAMIENLGELDNKIALVLGPAGLLYTIGETAIEALGKNKDDKTEGTLIGSFNATAESIINSAKETIALTNELNNIPTDIVTTHVINRIIKTTYV